MPLYPEVSSSKARPKRVSQDLRLGWKASSMDKKLIFFYFFLKKAKKRDVEQKKKQDIG
jgi:hypothetical protein